MRVMMTGGGTGGHVNPAIAIANIIKQNEPDSVVAFVGTSRGIENKLVPKAGYELFHVEVQGIKRRLTPANIKALWLAFTSVGHAKKLVKSFKPDLVVGTGGYVSWPVCRAAASLGIPTALHESNAIPGFAVRMLEKYVDRVYVNFEATRERLAFPDKCVRVGNPLKPEFLSPDREAARRELGIAEKYDKFILSCGGSMGAENVNIEVLRLMREYTSKHPEVLHVHATGAIEYEEATRQFRAAGLEQYPNLQMLEYIYDMPQRMMAADVVINRAGAMTLSEIAALGRASILIPSPNVTDNHQYKNARVLADAGAAVLIEEKEFTGYSEASESRLTEAVKGLLEDDSKREAISSAVSKFAVLDAADVLYRELRALVDSKSV
ncbi:MAG: undecaprenyldiphospho-muramoylpentapeptide beta-N-acetylglucosaminyltransferase [Clostridiales bacterium]|nr:undecaprenyldiphospho-muramoylpentapeptide beta-N-acetylglucosaminyltransferase [Clostridiales bacterium]